MQKFTLAGIAIASLLAASAALADDAAQATPGAAVQMALADAGQARVCSFQIHEGMLLRRPVCRTAHEFESLMRMRQREINEFQVHGSGTKSW